MAFLTDQDQQKIANAITEAERRTSGELVAVVAPAADDYRYVPLLWPAVVALLLPAMLLTIAPGMAVWTLYFAQATAFFVLALLLHLLPVRMALVPELAEAAPRQSACAGAIPRAALAPDAARAPAS